MGLPLLDRFLTLWIFAAMVVGVLLGQFAPSFADWLEHAKFPDSDASIPIAIGLIVMMYPPLAKVNYEKLALVFQPKRLALLSLFLNWVVGPLLMFGLGVGFLWDLEEY
ncbi:unnamed protein product, partial [Heterosigma akashiwo]